MAEGAIFIFNESSFSSDILNVGIYLADESLLNLTPGEQAFSLIASLNGLRSFPLT